MKYVYYYTIIIFFVPGPEVIEVPVWNGTVANLTLMALGSSAPEILLSVIEIVGNNMEAGELGPGTIVGSAAFNLLCISAVCVAGVPKVTNSLILASLCTLTRLVCGLPPL